MHENLLERITRDPEIMLGKPVVRGTRLPIDLLLEKLAYGCSEERLLEEYPFLVKDDVKAALLFASRMIALEEEYSV